MATPSGTSAGADRKKHGWVIRSHVGKVSCMMLKRMRTGGGPTSMVQVSEWYGWHFACRDRQKAAYRNVCPHAPRGYLGIHMDFGQSRTLQIGPKEGGRWWYANARVSVNVLVAYVWGCGMEGPSISHTSAMSWTTRLIMQLRFYTTSSAGSGQTKLTM